VGVIVWPINRTSNEEESSHLPFDRMMIRGAVRSDPKVHAAIFNWPNSRNYNSVHVTWVEIIIAAAGPKRSAVVAVFVGYAVVVLSVGTAIDRSGRRIYFPAAAVCPYLFFQIDETTATVDQNAVVSAFLFQRPSLCARSFVVAGERRIR
jgi:hypothetical protein